jgi:anti-sigma regulatory factor (Ser/Thr protein kinase)
MADTIRLVVTASPSALPVVRMVLGGVAARVDLSLEDIEDLYVAVEELLSAAEVQGEGPRHELAIEVSDDTLTINAGPFRTAGLKDRLSEEHTEAFGLRTVMDNVVQSIEVCTAPNDCFSVVFAKRRTAT